MGLPGIRSQPVISSLDLSGSLQLLNKVSRMRDRYVLVLVPVVDQHWRESRPCPLHADCRTEEIHDALHRDPCRWRHPEFQRKMPTQRETEQSEMPAIDPLVRGEERERIAACAAPCWKVRKNILRPDAGPGCRAGGLKIPGNRGADAFRHERVREGLDGGTERQ